MKRFLTIHFSLLVTVVLVGLGTVESAEPPHVAPKAWDDHKLASWALPVAGLGVAPGHFTEREHYQAPIDNLRTYPVYHPDREPSGYWEMLQGQRPQPLVEIGKAYSPDEWVQNGRRVFEELDVAGFRSGDAKLIERIRDKAEMAAVTTRNDGTLAGMRWVVTEDGIKLGINECASCHSRRMPDGSIAHGAPPNEFDSSNRVANDLILAGIQEFTKGDEPGMSNFRQFGVPWLKESDIHERLKTMPEEEVGALFATNISGTFARFNGSPFFPTKFPDLIGVRDLRYFDHTGTHQHREIGDLMRYAALITSSDSGDFGPHRMLSDAQRTIGHRHPDEVLYALAQYLYSIKPPPNPNIPQPGTDLAQQVARGEIIFKREDCARCHEPPLYTSNKLTPALGFTPPKEHFDRFHVHDESVETDPRLALKTRKGTGYYKIPSLRGVWYRGLYLHDGSLANLEDMFDKRRLLDNYEPTGFKGYEFKDGKGSPIKRRAVRGHEFGLELSDAERAQLVAFLRTL